MNQRVACTAASCIIFLAACGSKQDANEKNFGEAISQHLDKNGELCIPLKQWPVEVKEADVLLKSKMGITEKAGQMEALAAVGLASSTDAVVEDKSPFANVFGKPQKVQVKRYALTDAGKKFYKESKGICYGKLALEKVVKWEGPMKFGDYQEANVFYLYKIDDLASWAGKVEIQTSFPSVAQSVNGVGKRELQRGVKLTNLGWEPK